MKEWRAYIFKYLAKQLRIIAFQQVVYSEWSKLKSAPHAFIIEYKRYAKQ